jgi:hypothetical protein
VANHEALAVVDALLVGKAPPPAGRVEYALRSGGLLVEADF